MATHDVTITEHGAREGVFFAQCTCGWANIKPAGWKGILRRITKHREGV